MLLLVSVLLVFVVESTESADDPVTTLIESNLSEEVEAYKCRAFGNSYNGSVVEEYDLTKLSTGNWYGVAAIRDLQYGAGLTADFSTYIPILCLIYILTLEHDNKHLSMEYCCPEVPVGSSKYKLFFNQTGLAHYTNQSSFNESKNLDFIRLVDTDYENYMIIYGCKEVFYGEGVSITVTVYILLTHSPNITDDIQKHFFHFVNDTQGNWFIIAEYDYYYPLQCSGVNTGCVYEDVDYWLASLATIGDYYRSKLVKTQSIESIWFYENIIIGIICVMFIIIYLYYLVC